MSSGSPLDFMSSPCHLLRHLDLLLAVLDFLPPETLFSLRLVSRTFYLASMFLLRHTFLPHYLARVLYSSHPLPPVDLPPYAHRPPPLSVATINCETTILDRFIALSLRHSLFAAHSLLHTHRPDSFRDLFVYHQPKARLEDLVRSYALQRRLSIPFVISLSPRAISLVSASGNNRRTLAHVSRLPSLEHSAQALVNALFTQQP